MIISYLKTIIKEGKFDSELVYGDNDNYIKRKIMIYEDKVNSHFQDKKLSKENVSYKWLLLIMLGFVSKQKVLSSNTFGTMQIWSKNK